MVEDIWSELEWAYRTRTAGPRENPSLDDYVDLTEVEE